MDHAQPRPESGTDAEGLLRRAEADLATLDQQTTHDQVPGYQRIHESLLQALAHTAPSGSGMPGAPGPPGTATAAPSRPSPPRPGMPGPPRTGRPGA